FRSFFITLPLHLFHTTLYFTHKTYSVNSPFVVRKETHTNAHNLKTTLITLTPMLIITNARSSHAPTCSESQILVHPRHPHATNHKSSDIALIHMLIITNPRSSHTFLCSYSRILDHRTHPHAHIHKSSLIAHIPMLITINARSSNTFLCS